MFYIVYLKIYEYKYSQTLCHFFFCLWIGKAKAINVSVRDLLIDLFHENVNYLGFADISRHKLHVGNDHVDMVDVFIKITWVFLWQSFTLKFIKHYKQQCRGRSPECLS